MSWRLSNISKEEEEELVVTWIWVAKTVCTKLTLFVADACFAFGFVCLFIRGAGGGKYPSFFFLFSLRGAGAESCVKSSTHNNCSQRSK